MEHEQGEQSWRLTGGFTCANEIMDDVVARAVFVLMFNSNRNEAGRFCVPSGDHLSQGLGSTARVKKASEVYEEARERFAALTPDDQLLEMHRQKPQVEPEFGWIEARMTETKRRRPSIPETWAELHNAAKLFMSGDQAGSEAHIDKLKAMRDGNYTTDAERNYYRDHPEKRDSTRPPPSPPCSPPGSPKINNPEYGPFWPSCELCCGKTEAVEVGKCRASKGKEVSCSAARSAAS